MSLGLPKCAAIGSLCFALTGCGGGGPATATTTGAIHLSENSGDLSGWTLVWNDEFDQMGLPDSTKWVFDTHRNKEGWYNGELQYYSQNRLENAQVIDGKLVITARHEQLTAAPDYGGQNYTSARLITQGKASWTYGRFEIRAKLPCTLGMWPAIWMLGSGGAWPLDGEIDIMEQKGQMAEDKRQILGTVHTLANHNENSLGAYRSLPTACMDFNTYQMTWDANKVVIGVNGVDYFTYTNPGDGARSKWPFDRPHYLLLNLAVGGRLGGVVDDNNLPAIMEVDYVRVFQKLQR